MLVTTSHNGWGFALGVHFRRTEESLGALRATTKQGSLRGRYRPNRSFAGTGLVSGGAARPTRTSRTPPDMILTLVLSTRLLPRVVKITSVPAKMLSCASPPSARRQQKERYNRLKGREIARTTIIQSHIRFSC